jgi:uncharacterized delta-60 repeat protein
MRAQNLQLRAPAMMTNPLTARIEMLEERQLLSASSIDTTFNGAGAATLRIGGQAWFNKTSVMSDGRVIAAGFAYTQVDGRRDPDFLVARFTAAGKLDPTFGNGRGYVTTDFGNATFDEAETLVQLPGGKILIAGTGGGNFNLVRYNSDGSVDTSFSGDGKGSYYSRGRLLAMTLTSSGSVILGGWWVENGATSDDLLLMKVKSDGSLDTSFSGDGKAIVDLGSTSSYAVQNDVTSLAIQPDGKIIVGSTYDYNTSDDTHVTRFCIARFYTASGTLDKSFGNGKGYTLASAQSNAAYQDINAVALLPNGNILAGGKFRSLNESDPETTEFALMRFKSNGALDTGFGSGGITLTSFGSGRQAAVNTIIPQANGKVLAVGQASFDAAVARYTSSGKADTSFSGDGKFIAFNRYLAEGAAPAPGGKYVIAGFNTNNSGIVERYGVDSASNSSISGTVYKDVNRNGTKNSGEAGLAGWQVYIDANNDGFYTPGEAMATTNTAGNYRIAGLAPGTYRVREYRQNGWTRTQPAGDYPLGFYDITLGISQSVFGKNFGNMR